MLLFNPCPGNLLPWAGLVSTCFVLNFKKVVGVSSGCCKCVIEG